MLPSTDDKTDHREAVLTDSCFLSDVGPTKQSTILLLAELT